MSEVSVQLVLVSMKIRQRFILNDELFLDKP